MIVLHVGLYVYYHDYLPDSMHAGAEPFHWEICKQRLFVCTRHYRKADLSVAAEEDMVYIEPDMLKLFDR